VQGRAAVSVQIPGYVIHREIGSGGMAKVFLATQTSLDRQVALKIMSPALAADPTFAKRFQREARTIASLAHPNIAAVYEVGSIQHLHFFAMQYLSGGDLSGRLKKGISEAELARILSGIAKALGFAHSRGIVHRDVTPGNVLFDQADHPILTDFGIARAQHGATKITHTGVSIGTSSYMSPEQARGGEVDARSDLYSLGALLFESLSGKPPYQGVDGFAVAYAHVFEPIPRLAQGLQHWQPLIDRAMSKAPDDRFANAEEFVAAMLAIGPSESRMVPWREGASTLSAPAQAPRTDPELKTQAMLVPSNPAKPQRASVLAIPSSAPKASAAAASAAPNIFKPIAKPQRLAWWLSVSGVLALLVLAGFTRGFGFWPATQDSMQPPVLSTTAQASFATPAIIAATTPKDATLSGFGTNQDPMPSTDPAGADLAGVDLAGVDPVSVDPEDPADPKALPVAPLVAIIPFDAGNPRSFTGPLGRRDFVARFVAAAELAKREGRLTLPKNNNVVDLMAVVRRIDPTNPEITKRVLEAAALLAEQAKQKYDATAYSEVSALLDNAIAVARAADPKDPSPTTWEAMRLGWIKERVESGKQAELIWDVKRAGALYQEIEQLLPEQADAKAGLKRIESIGKPGFRFRTAMKSGGQSPFMRVIGPGTAVLRDDRNGSARIQVAQSYAIGERETTREEYERFVLATRRASANKGCNDREGFAMFTSRERTWKAPGFAQTAAHPVTCVSHSDAEAYARWLAQQTGENFRLPSEPEWRLAAGNLGPGECSKANLADQTFVSELKGRDALTCSDGFAGTAPTGSFPAGPNQLLDFAGNVREWVADCYSRSVLGRGSASGPWQNSSCNDHLALGTSWVSGTDERNQQPRQRFGTNDLNNTVGFRIAMDLPSGNL